MGSSARGRFARPRLAAAGAVLAAVALALGGVAPSASGEDIDHKVAQASDDLAAASKAVTRANSALERARTQLPAARAEVAAAAEDVAAAQADEDAAAAAAERATAVALSAQEDVVDAQARIVDMNGQITDLTRAVYMQGPYAELAAILTAATPSEFADRLEAIRSVSRSQNRALTDLTAAKADLALASAQAEAARAKAEAKRVQALAAVTRASAAAARAKAAKARVDSLVRERSSALTVAAREKARVKKQYEDFKKEQARIRALEKGPGGFTGRATGSLIWPIPGAVVVEVAGPRTHPVYGYKSCHTGVDIRGWYGTPIVSPAAGKVMSVVNGGAFGLHTIVSHGNGVTTMYAHQSSTAVRVGQVVSQGQTIGYVGATGWVTGPHLHWEVHVNGVPYDPMGWFGGSKGPISCWNG